MCMCHDVCQCVLSNPSHHDFSKHLQNLLQSLPNPPLNSSETTTTPARHRRGAWEQHQSKTTNESTPIRYQSRLVLVNGLGFRLVTCKWILFSSLSVRIHGEVRREWICSMDDNGYRYFISEIVIHCMAAMELGLRQTDRKLAILKSPEIFYEFRRLRVSQTHWNSGKMRWPIFAATILQCDKPVHLWSDPLISFFA